MNTILTLDIAKGDRADLERIQGTIFNSVEAIRDEFPNDNGLGIYTLDEFMDACNDTDDHTPFIFRVDTSSCWVGYVELRKV